MEQVETEQDFNELLLVAADYFVCLDKDEEEAQVKQILANRQSLTPDAPFNPNQNDFKTVRELLTNSLTI